jgi:dCMP deaminase
MLKISWGNNKMSEENDLEEGPNSSVFRISFEKIYMRLAFDLASRSTCSRLKVGCVVVSSDYSRVHGIGYNGNAAGFSNSCDSLVPGNCGCLHAEDNAMLKTNGGPEMLKIVFVTHQPCSYCAKRIINKGGIKKVYYALPYRKKDGLEILNAGGIDVFQMVGDFYRPGPNLNFQGDILI